MRPKERNARIWEALLRGVGCGHTVRRRWCWSRSSHAVPQFCPPVRTKLRNNLWRLALHTCQMTVNAQTELSRCVVLATKKEKGFFRFPPPLPTQDPQIPAAQSVPHPGIKSIANQLFNVFDMFSREIFSEKFLHNVWGWIPTVTLKVFA